MSPTTTEASAEAPSDRVSTPPSSPPQQSPNSATKPADEAQNNGIQEQTEGDGDDEDEGLGDKGKALTHLLNTSSVRFFHPVHFPL